MPGRKPLVVCYSRTGTTRKVAEAVAEMLDCEIEEISDTKKRSGPLGWLRAARDAALRRKAVIQDVKRDPADYEPVIIGTPVWAFSVSCPVRAFLSQYRDRLGRVAFFLTTGGSGIKRTFRHMAELCEKTPIAQLALKMREVKKGVHLDKVKAFVAEVMR